MPNKQSVKTGTRLVMAVFAFVSVAAVPVAAPVNAADTACDTSTAPADFRASITRTRVTLDNAKVDFTFANPTTQTTGDCNILNELKRLIYSTKPGDRVHMAVAMANSTVISGALTYAMRNGVEVHLIANENDECSLCSDVEKYYPGNVTRCNHGNTAYGCISRDPAGHMHNKFVLFSGATDPDGVRHANVVWSGTANLNASSGRQTFNTAFVDYGDAAMYGGLLRIWNTLHKKTAFANDNFFSMAKSDGSTGYVESAYSNIRAYASPANAESSNEDGPDTVLDRLGDGITGESCMIRVMQMAISDHRLAVAQRLAELNEKCTVRVIVRAKDNGEPILGPEVRKTFEDAGVPVAAGPIHDKSISVTYVPAGTTAPRYLFLTGSQNLTGPALRRNDELLFKFVGSGAGAKGIYYGFQNHFQAASNASTCVPGVRCWSEVPS